MSKFLARLSARSYGQGDSYPPAELKLYSAVVDGAPVLELVVNGYPVCFLPLAGANRLAGVLATLLAGRELGNVDEPEPAKGKAELLELARQLEAAEWELRDRGPALPVERIIEHANAIVRAVGPVRAHAVVREQLEQSARVVSVTSSPAGSVLAVLDDGRVYLGRSEEPPNAWRALPPIPSTPAAALETVDA